MLRVSVACVEGLWCAIGGCCICLQCAQERICEPKVHDMRDFSAYLRRIGVTGTPRADIATLQRLVLRQALAVLPAPLRMAAGWEA